MAERETDLKIKEKLLRQAAAYRKLANDRAKKLIMPLPKPPPDSPCR